MDKTALFSLTYGLYVVGSMDGDRPVGCIINTCFQVTSEPPTLAISLNKNNYTLEVIQKTQQYSLSVIAENTDPSIIGQFGFYSSRDTDKYSDYGFTENAGTPLVNGDFCGRLILEAIKFVDCGTHVIVIGQLKDAIAGKGTPMTYSYYHRVIKGKAPKNAPTYVAEEPKAQEGTKQKFRCNLCGYEAEFEGDIPDDFKCPLCQSGKNMFSKVE